MYLKILKPASSPLPPRCRLIIELEDVVQATRCEIWSDGTRGTLGALASRIWRGSLSLFLSRRASEGFRGRSRGRTLRDNGERVLCKMRDEDSAGRENALTPRCSWKEATVPWTPGTSCSRSASSVRPCPWWRVHWDPWLQPHPPGRNRERNSACASAGKSIGRRAVLSGAPCNANAVLFLSFSHRGAERGGLGTHSRGSVGDLAGEIMMTTHRAKHERRVQTDPSRSRVRRTSASKWERRAADDALMTRGVRNQIYVCMWARDAFVSLSLARLRARQTIVCEWGTKNCRRCRYARSDRSLRELSSLRRRVNENFLSYQ